MKFAGIAFFVSMFAINALAADAYFVLSGGDSPASNHYSQYLQTNALFSYLSSIHPTGATVAFGAGNQSGVPASIADVHRVALDESIGQKVSQMVPGSIPGILINPEQAIKMKNCAKAQGRPGSIARLRN